MLIDCNLGLMNLSGFVKCLWPQRHGLNLTYTAWPVKAVSTPLFLRQGKHMPINPPPHQAGDNHLRGEDAAIKRKCLAIIGSGLTKNHLAFQHIEDIPHAGINHAATNPPCPPMNGHFHRSSIRLVVMEYHSANQ